jgi:hypothetical protein
MGLANGVRGWTRQQLPRDRGSLRAGIRSCLEKEAQPDVGRRSVPEAWQYTQVMPRMIAGPSVIQAAGNKPKRIEEYAGRVNSGHAGVSVARVQSPEGSQAAGAAAAVRRDHRRAARTLRVEYEGGVPDIDEEQALITTPGEWVRYSTPFTARTCRSHHWRRRRDARETPS